MRLLVCGDRNWGGRDNEALLRERLEALRPEVVIHGCARGADRMAGRLAGELGCVVVEFPAQWDKFGRAAGPIRNQQMLDEGSPDHVLWCHHDLNSSRGTADMVRRAQKAGIPTEGIGG